MSLPHALLTALVERPCSGSDLAVRFDKSIGYFWHATHQQIYRELAKLEEGGLIESLPEEPTRGRKRAYRILTAGLDELRRWLAQQDDAPVLRDELMVRLWAEAAVGPTDLHQEIRRRITLHEDKLALYRRFEAHDFPDGPHGREARLRYLVLQTGIRYEIFWIDTARQALEILELSSEPAEGGITP